MAVGTEIHMQAATRLAPPPQRPRRRSGNGNVAYLFLSPWLAGAMLLTLGPMLASLYLSFTDYDLFTTPEWIGLRNYDGWVVTRAGSDEILLTTA